MKRLGIIGFAVALMGLSAPAQALPLRLDIQEFSYCGGSSVDITCDADVDRGYIARLFAQIDIIVNFLGPVQTLLNRSFTTDPGFPGEVDPFDTLTDFRTAVPTPLRDKTVHVGYVPDLYGSTVGLGYVDTGSGAPPFSIVDSAALSTAALSLTVVHEIGHNLGGRHYLDVETDPIPAGYVMSASFNPATVSTDTLLPFTAESTARLRSSALLTPVPLPPALAMLLAAVLSLAMLRQVTRRSTLGA